MNTKLLALSSLCFVATSFAKQDQRQEQGLSFDDIRIACQNPARFHNQTAPTNIQISCRDIQNKWVPDTEGTVAMPTGRLVTSSIYSDKYAVYPQTAAVPSMEQVVSCANFKEVSEVVETVRAVSCDELVAFNGTSIDFCSAAVNSLRSANKDAVTAQATGRLASLCGGTKGVDQRNDQRGQH